MLEWAERRWARAADRRPEVNDPYAGLLDGGLRVPLPRGAELLGDLDPPSPRPDLIRATLGLPADTPIVLYQGVLALDRGIEQAMDAILEVPRRSWC